MVSKINGVNIIIKGYVCSACFEYFGTKPIMTEDEQKKDWKKNWTAIAIFESQYECELHCKANHGATGHAEPKKVILFYRSSGEYGFLSNLYRTEIQFENRTFRSSEDAYQFGKPLDCMTAEWIVSAPKPHLCAMAAHGLFAFDIRPDWNDIKVNRMREVLKAKFTQHEDLKQKLIETGDAILVEDSKSDAFWGIGKMKKGKNMLGVLLMETRADIKDKEMSDAEMVQWEYSH